MISSGLYKTLESCANVRVGNHFVSGTGGSREGEPPEGDEFRNPSGLLDHPDVGASGCPVSRPGRPRAEPLIYEGHDVYKTTGVDPKRIDQPMTTPRGGLTENGKFYKAAKDAAAGRRRPERVKVYEKIHRGVWSDKGFFQLVDAEVAERKGRKVFDFFLRPIRERFVLEDAELPANRLIPTEVKVAVWKRDHGKCVLCGSQKNLHYDHDLPYSKGGSSITVANVRLLCATHNLKKSAKIEALLPFVVGLASLRS